MKGTKPLNICARVMCGGATDFRKNAAGPKGGDKKLTCMFMQKTTPNQMATWAGFSMPIRPISSSGNFWTIGRKIGMTRRTMLTQSIIAPRNRKISIMIRMTPIVGMSEPMIEFAI